MHFDKFCSGCFAAEAIATDYCKWQWFNEAQNIKPRAAVEMAGCTVGVLGSSTAGSSNRAFCNVMDVFLLFTLHDRISHKYTICP